MQLKQRVKKLEQINAEKNLEFCLCFGRFPEHAFILIPTEERKPDSLEYSKPLPDFCEKCQKPVDRSKVNYPTAEFWEMVNERLEQTKKNLIKRNEY
jgi:hypothetical protein